LRFLLYKLPVLLWDHRDHSSRTCPAQDKAATCKTLLEFSNRGHHIDPVQCCRICIHQEIGHVLMELNVPRVKDMRLASGTVELWTLLANKFGLGYDQLEIIIPTAFGFLWEPSSF
jgi:hypothetical protein